MIGNRLVRVLTATLDVVLDVSDRFASLVRFDDWPSPEDPLAGG